jgi:hypothetical protein
MRRRLASLLIGLTLTAAFGLGIGVTLRAQDDELLLESFRCPKSVQCDCVLLVCDSRAFGCTTAWCGLLSTHGGGCYQACDNPTCSYQEFYCDDYCM